MDILDARAAVWQREHQSAAKLGAGGKVTKKEDQKTYTGDCLYCSEAGHKWADCRKRLADIKCGKCTRDWKRCTLRVKVGETLAAAVAASSMP